MSLPLLYHEIQGIGCDQFKILIIATFTFHISQVLTLKMTHCKIKPHACVHHVVIIELLTLCYSIIPHATLILYYHASMLTLQTSLYHVHFGCHMQAIREVRV